MEASTKRGTTRRAKGTAVRLEILRVPGCPNAAVLETQLAQLLADRPDICVTSQLVVGHADAERLGMTGSPTLLADGADPFACPGQQPSLSCRLYFDEHGRPAPAPSLAQLRGALGL
jgi:hypothetical protein